MIKLLTFLTVFVLTAMHAKAQSAMDTVKNKPAVDSVADTTQVDTVRHISVRKNPVRVTIADAQKLEKDSTYLLGNIAFQIDRHEFRPGCDGDVALLYQKLVDNPALRIEIQGHVCCIRDAADALDVGTNEPNLSLNRAKEIYNCLIGRGIDPARVKYVGMGKQRPIVENETTNEEAALNRRVEIKILEN